MNYKPNSKSIAFFENSLEFNLFSNLNFESFEELIRPNPEKFLTNYSPNRLNMLKRVLGKIGFKFNGSFITDLTMSMRVGGYFAPDQNIIAINPYLLLHGTEKEIAHVLFHEGLHAGIYTGGTKLMEEVVVETMTKKKIAEIYGGTEFKSGYDGMVDEASEFFGELSFEEMTEKVEDGDEKTFDNYLELMTTGPALADGNITDLSWDSIYGRLQKKWGMIQRLFPRMINQIAGNGRGLHEEAKLNAYQFKLEGLLEKCAEKLICENQDLITELFLKITDNAKRNMSVEEIIRGLIEKGFAYLIDKDSEAIERMINLFLLQVELSKTAQTPITHKVIQVRLG